MAISEFQWKKLLYTKYPEKIFVFVIVFNVISLDTLLNFGDD